jgi:hypothetical protein
MNQSNGSYRIEPLRKDNYDTWVLQARAIIRRIGLWEYVSGKATKPDDSQSEKSSKNGKQTIKMLSLN